MTPSRESREPPRNRARWRAQRAKPSRGSGVAKDSPPSRLALRPPQENRAEAGEPKLRELEPCDDSARCRKGVERFAKGPASEWGDALVDVLPHASYAKARAEILRAALQDVPRSRWRDSMTVGSLTGGATRTDWSHERRSTPVSTGLPTRAMRPSLARRAAHRKASSPTL